MAEDLTFALDIGTRTIIGLLIKKDKTGYEIIHSAVSEHPTRAMLDGQIHNVVEVAGEVKKVKEELEAKSGKKLKKVAIAAAGRALRTVNQSFNLELDKKTFIETEDVNRLELLAIQKAQSNLSANENQAEENLNYHFVGYSVSKYRLDGIEIGELIGQRGQNLEADLVATFLPRIVIDSLLSVINRVDLEVEHLTLEPIAASHVVIPESMSTFNLALVDIGAGTSDIAITKDGSIIGYDMVPIAGDEITEQISESFLIDYNTAEKVKCNLQKEETLNVKTILGDDIEIDSQSVLEVIEPQLDTLTESIAESILNINTTPPQAVIFIGGGSLTLGLKEKFSDKIDLIPNRIGIRKKDDLENVLGEIEKINSTQTLTPIGIAVTTEETQNKAVFIDVEVNDETVNLLTISQPTIADAFLAADIDIKDITPSMGMGITCTINGELKTVKGEFGEKGSLYLNGREASLDTKVSTGDQINFDYAKPGKDAKALIEELIPDKDLVSYHIYLDGSKNEVKTQIYQNKNWVTKETPVKDGANIKYNIPQTIKDGISQLLEIPPDILGNKRIEFTFNGEKKEIVKSPYLIREEGNLVNLDRKIENNLKLTVEKKENNEVTIGDFLQTEGNNDIKIEFNGSDLEIPNKFWEIGVNGDQEDINYKIEEGDKIRAWSKKLTVDRVFEHINYNISNTMKENLNIKINQEEASLKSKIKDGDKLLIEVSKKSNKF
ncbi:MAG TPA: cell division protein FtsA [Halanaerobiales bacterium]|nr:cell division protein FtsA [Halanaerobiales bacterium]